MQWSNDKSTFLSLNNLYTFSISVSFAIPVDTIVGFLVLIILFINWKFDTSNEAILYIGTFKVSRKSTDSWSKGVEKIVELKLSQDEKENFKKSVDAVSKLFDAAKKIDPDLA